MRVSVPSEGAVWLIPPLVPATQQSAHWRKYRLATQVFRCFVCGNRGNRGWTGRFLMFPSNYSLLVFMTRLQPALSTMRSSHEHENGDGCDPVTSGFANKKIPFYVAPPAAPLRPSAEWDGALLLSRGLPPPQCTKIACIGDPGPSPATGYGVPCGDSCSPESFSSSYPSKMLIDKPVTHGTFSAPFLMSMIRYQPGSPSLARLASADCQ